MYAFASVSTNQISIVLSGTGVDSTKLVTVEVPGVKMASKSIRAVQYNAEVIGKKTVMLGEKHVPVEVSRKSIQVAVEQNSFVLISIK